MFLAVLFRLPVVRKQGVGEISDFIHPRCFAFAGNNLSGINQVASSSQTQSSDKITKT